METQSLTEQNPDAQDLMDTATGGNMQYPEHIIKRADAIEFISVHALEIHSKVYTIINQNKVDFVKVDNEYGLLNVELCYLFLKAKQNLTDAEYDTIHDAYKTLEKAVFYTQHEGIKKVKVLFEELMAEFKKSLPDLEEHVNSINQRFAELKEIDYCIDKINEDQKIRFKRIILLQRLQFANEMKSYLAFTETGSDTKKIDNFDILKQLMVNGDFYLSQYITPDKNEMDELLLPTLPTFNEDGEEIIRVAKQERKLIVDKIKELNNEILNKNGEVEIKLIKRSDRYTGKPDDYCTELYKFYKEYKDMTATDFTRQNGLYDFNFEDIKELKEIISKDNVDNARRALCKDLTDKIKEREAAEKLIKSYSWWEKKMQDWHDKDDKKSRAKIFGANLATKFLEQNSKLIWMNILGKTKDKNEVWIDILKNAGKIVADAFIKLIPIPFVGPLVGGFIDALLSNGPSQEDPFKEDVKKALGRIEAALTRIEKELETIKSGIKDLSNKIENLPETMRKVVLAALEEKDLINIIQKLTAQNEKLKLTYEIITNPSTSAAINYREVMAFEEEIIDDVKSLFLKFIGKKLEIKLDEEGRYILDSTGDSTNFENSIAYRLKELAILESKTLTLHERSNQSEKYIEVYANSIQEVIGAVKDITELSYKILAGVVAVTGFPGNLKALGEDVNIERFIEDGLHKKTGLYNSLERVPLLSIATGDSTFRLRKQIYSGVPTIQEGLFFEKEKVKNDKGEEVEKSKFESIAEFFSMWTLNSQNERKDIAPVLNLKPALTKPSSTGVDNTSYNSNEINNKQYQIINGKDSLHSLHIQRFSEIKYGDTDNGYIITKLEKVYLSDYAFFELSKPIKEEEKKVYLCYKIQDSSNNSSTFWSPIELISLDYDKSKTYQILYNYYPNTKDKENEKKKEKEPEFEIGIATLNSQGEVTDRKVVRFKIKQGFYGIVYEYVKDEIAEIKYVIDALSGWMYIDKPEPSKINNVIPRLLEPRQILFKGQEIDVEYEAEKYHMKLVLGPKSIDQLKVEEGNLVLIDMKKQENQILWQSYTHRTGMVGEMAYFSPEGNLEIYDKKGKVVWAAYGKRDNDATPDDPYVVALNSKQLISDGLKGFDETYLGYSGFLNIFNGKQTLTSLRKDSNFKLLWKDSCFLLDRKIYIDAKTSTKVPITHIVDLEAYLEFTENGLLLKANREIPWGKGYAETTLVTKERDWLKTDLGGKKARYLIVKKGIISVYDGDDILLFETTDKVNEHKSATKMELRISDDKNSIFFVVTDEFGSNYVTIHTEASIPNNNS
ncbi:MAG: hypothetical protein MUF43_01150 [Flavobacterium sp.]|nr:hypothetical protein [Flavobacterium sp.]